MQRMARDLRILAEVLTDMADDAEEKIEKFKTDAYMNGLAAGYRVAATQILKRIKDHDCLPPKKGGDR